MEEHVPSSSDSVSIAWILKLGRRCLVRLGRPCTAPGRVKSSTSTIYVEACGPLGNDGLGEDGGYSYILVVMDDMSNWVLLEPTGGMHGPLDNAASPTLVEDHWGSGGAGE